MPFVNGLYQAPLWKNGEAPAIDKDELQAMCDCIQDRYNATYPTTLTSYLGTGSYGSANKNYLDFTNAIGLLPSIVTITPQAGEYFEPVVITLYPRQGIGWALFFGTYHNINVNLTNSDTAVEWYSSQSSAIQGNESGVTYYYSAIF